jgi:transposase
MAGIRTAGVDWASEAHEVCVSEEGQVVARFSVTHDERGIEKLVGQLAAQRVDRVAIERPDGILVERLLDARLEVLAIHPSQMKAARPRYAVAHGKSDRFDAFVLAELARTDAHRFRALVPDSDETKALRALTRAREDMVEARVALANQLRAQLEAFWPGR